MITAVGIIYKLKTGTVAAEELSARGQLLEAPSIDEAKRAVLTYYQKLGEHSKLSIKFEPSLDGEKYIVDGIPNRATKMKKGKRGAAWRGLQLRNC